MPFIKKFNKNKNKLKGFLIKVKIKIANKGLSLLMPIKQVAYTELFLISKILK